MAASLVLINPDGTKNSLLGICMIPHYLQIPKGMLLSFRCYDYKGVPKADGVFTMGAAVAELRHFSQTTEDGWCYFVTIESPNASDFVAAWREIFRRLGMPIEDLTPPSWVSPNEQSLIRGLGNDLRNFRKKIQSWFSNQRRRIFTNK